MAANPSTSYRLPTLDPSLVAHDLAFVKRPEHVHLRLDGTMDIAILNQQETLELAAWLRDQVWPPPKQMLASLAVKLGGSEDSFTGQLLRLMRKADPGNRRRLAVAFPSVSAALEEWEAEDLESEDPG